MNIWLKLFYSFFLEFIKSPDANSTSSFLSPWSWSGRREETVCLVSRIFLQGGKVYSFRNNQIVSKSKQRCSPVVSVSPVQTQPRERFASAAGLFSWAHDLIAHDKHIMSTFWWAHEQRSIWSHAQFFFLAHLLQSYAHSYSETIIFVFVFVHIFYLK